MNALTQTSAPTCDTRSTGGQSAEMDLGSAESRVAPKSLSIGPAGARSYSTARSRGLTLASFFLFLDHTPTVEDSASRGVIFESTKKLIQAKGHRPSHQTRYQADSGRLKHVGPRDGDECVEYIVLEMARSTLTDRFPGYIFFRCALGFTTEWTEGPGL